LRRDLALLPEGALSPTLLQRLASVRTPSDALRFLVDALPLQSEGRRRIIVAHGSIKGAVESDSERPIPGGAGVDVGVFAGAAYVALGHHHRPQDVDERVRYSGSPLMYSFAEVGQEKSVTVVDIGPRGEFTKELVTIARGRSLAVVEGTLSALLAAPDRDAADCYVKARLLDDGPVLDPHARLREHYPHLLVVEHARLRRLDDARPSERSQPVLDDAALFRAFFLDVTGATLTDDEERVFASVHEALDAERRGGE
jgi:exonuclease SbcD